MKKSYCHEVWFDGSCAPINPGGYCGYGYFISSDGQKIKEESKCVGSGAKYSNNVGEYEGLKSALKWLKDQGFRHQKIKVYGDSRLVIEQNEGFLGCC